MIRQNSKPLTTALRYRRLRDDASIASAEKSIAREFGLPPGSIRLVLPNGRKARSDKDIAGLRKDWRR